ncbi:hypothetical protein GCM10023171_32250 [Microbacterium panaciterrae]|uniref:2-oxoglutarate dehydrogenase n=1 Tax=Microbacterium panaciterrae TaxID=985759 RepID=A0ABP8PPT1_9MICO
MRRALGVAAVALALLLPLSTVSPALAAETPAPSPSLTPAHAGLQMSLLPDANGGYTSGAPLTTTLDIHNDDTAGLGPGSVHLELGRTALADRAAVSAWLAGSGPAPALSSIGDARIGALAAGDDYRTSVVVPGADVGALSPGVYPVRATFEASTTGASPHATSVTSSSVVVVARGAAPTVITIVPITATPAGDLLSPAELTALTGPTGALTVQLNGAAGTPAVLAIDPAIAAAIRVLGAGAPATATAWLARLEALPNERFLLQFGDADVAAQAAAGMTSPLTVSSFDPFTNPSGKPPATPAPSPSPSSGSTAPGGIDLAGIAGARDDILWPRGQVTAAEIATMAGYQPADATRAIPILPSSTFASGTGGEAVPPFGTVGGTAVLVTDAAVSAALSSAAVESDATRRGAALTEASAMLWFSPPGSTVLAGLSRADVRSDQGLTAAVTAFSGGQDGRLSRVLATPPTDLAVATTSAADRAAAVTTLNSDAGRLAQFATILDRPDDLIVRERIAIMRLLGVGVNPTPEDFASALKTHRKATTTTLQAVGIQPSNPILISAKVDVPVWVRNDLPYPVHVQLYATAGDPRIDVPAMTAVDAQASSTTRVKIPVEAHVANAEIGLTMRLTSPTGVAIGSTQTAQLTIRAEWETIGLIVFGGLAVLLIGAGIFRTVRRRRGTTVKHAADGMEADQAEGEPADEAPSAGGNPHE